MIVVLDVIGAVGDTICSEPIVRYAIKNLPGDDIRIMTNRPQIFKHLNRPMGISFEELGVDPHNCVHLFNRPEMYVDGKFQLHPLIQYAPPLLVHTVDFLSMIMLRRSLPDEDKKVQLSFIDRTKEVEEKVGGPLEELVLLHAGSAATDQIRNFPESYNERLQKELNDAGLKVVLIGKESDRGPYPAKAYSPTIDLVDQLGWDELLTIISKARILVTNDSAPVHIASVFDNWIILLPTIRHPDRLLHVRNGNRYYKAHALFKKMILDEATQVPIHQYLYHYVDWSEAEKKREEHLPDPEYVRHVVTKFCTGTVGSINPQ